MSLKSEISYFVVENFLYGHHHDFGDDVSFIEKGILDSTGILELVCFVEKRYGIAVADEEIIPENFDSIGKLTGFVLSKIS
jgi:acyl carrier protein